MSPGLKLFLYVCLSISLFLVRDIRVHSIITGCLAAALFFIPFKMVSGGFLPIVLFLSFTFISNLFYQSGRVLFFLAGVTVTDEGLTLASIRTLRVFDLIYAAKLLAATTAMEDMVGSLRNILLPLEKIGLPVRDFFLTVGLTLKCFPIIRQKLNAAYREGVNGKNAVTVPERIRLVVSFLVPLFVESIRDPEEFFR